MSTETRKQILDAATAMENKDLRTVLMFLVTVLDEQGSKIDELGSKIDKMRADEKGLRDAVLNGHSGHHDQHHAWVARQIGYHDEHIDDHKWIKERRTANCESACNWAAEKMVAEKNDKTRIQRIVDAWIADAGKYVMGGLLTLLVLGAAAYFG
jgi:hypothetical protein